MGYQTDLPTEAIVNSYDVSLSPFMILIFFGVGLGTILLATIIPMIYVLRLNPKKIML
jgi:putative ABC transport system permease protein